MQQRVNSSQQGQPTQVAESKKANKPVVEIAAASKKTKKLSYKDQRELETLPQTIETLENDISRLQETVNSPDFFSQESNKTQSILQALTDAESALDAAFERWEELEDMQKRLLENARKKIKKVTVEIENYTDFKKSIENKKRCLVAWCEDEESENKIKEETGAKTSCMPLSFSYQCFLKLLFSFFLLPDSHFLKVLSDN